MVGAKLYYLDDTIQHAGVVVGLGGVAAHVLCKLPGDAEGYMGRLRCVQEMSAVTAACMMVKTSVFKAVGGFDEELKVAFNDIDLCMKVRDKGEKILFTPYAELYHYECACVAEVARIWICYAFCLIVADFHTLTCNVKNE